MASPDNNQRVLFNRLGLKITESESGRRRLYLGQVKLLSWKSQDYVKQLNTTIQELTQQSQYLGTIDSIFNTQLQDPTFEADILYHSQNDKLGLCSCITVSDLSAVLGSSNITSAYQYSPNKIPNYIVVHGLRSPIDSIVATNVAKNYNIPLFISEDGFLRSATTYVANCAHIYTRPVSFNFDPYGAYFDCTHHSLLEQYLNDPNLNLSAEQLSRARRCIEFLITNYLTKYNHQPINDHLLDHIKGKKVLVVDQSYGDMSIYRGGASDLTFKLMLEKACEENPDSTIIVKTHPDAIASNKVKAYYANLVQTDRVKRLTDAINPISLIQQCDRVYVCTSQFGFEALMCGKDVQIFGRPFYAGYGVGTNRQTMQRQRQRSLEEIFYLAYIQYTHYINPFTQKPCEIEEAMESLVKLREQYWQEYGSK